MGNLFHHDDGFRHDFAAFFRIRGRFFRNLLGFAGVVGILLDVRGHLFHRGGDLLGGGGLLRRALRHGFRAAAQFFAADGDIFRGVFYVRHDFFQLLNHRVQRPHQAVLLRAFPRLHAQIALRHFLRQLRNVAHVVNQRVQIIRHLVEIALIRERHFFWNVPFGNPIQARGAHIDRRDEGVYHVVHANHQLAPAAFEGVRVAASA